MLKMDNYLDRTPLSPNQVSTDEIWTRLNKIDTPKTWNNYTRTFGLPCTYKMLKKWFCLTTNSVDISWVDWAKWSPREMRRNKRRPKNQTRLGFEPTTQTFATVDTISFVQRVDLMRLLKSHGCRSTVFLFVDRSTGVCLLLSLGIGHFAPYGACMRVVDSACFSWNACH